MALNARSNPRPSRNSNGEKMLIKKFVLIAVIFSFFAPPMSMFAQDAGALLDLLVKKKLITDQEAEEVRARDAEGSVP